MIEDNVDWEKVKQILCGISEALNLVCKEIPPGQVNIIVCSVAAVLSLVCKSIPEPPPPCQGNRK